MTSEQQQEPRWRFRFDNYQRAFKLLRVAIETMEEREFTQIEKEGVVQRFEYTWELAWNTIKDYLELDGVILKTITPGAVLRAAVTAKLIENGEVWMDALDTRNKMAHTYNLKKFEAAIEKIRSNYLALFEALYMRLLEEIADPEDA